jgi:hypothetical protein
VTTIKQNPQYLAKLNIYKIHYLNTIEFNLLYFISIYFPFNCFDTINLIQHNELVKEKSFTFFYYIFYLDTLKLVQLFFSQINKAGDTDRW